MPRPARGLAALLLVLGAGLFVVAGPSRVSAASAPPFKLWAPWVAGATNVVGGSGSFWGENGHRNDDYHAVDISTSSGSPCGQEIRATADGTVTGETGYGWNGGYGNQVVIDHGGGYVSRYAHLQNITANVGQRVGHGAAIGHMGASGSVRPAGVCHLHFVIQYVPGGISVPNSPLSGVALYDGVRIRSDNEPGGVGLMSAGNLLRNGDFETGEQPWGAIFNKTSLRHAYVADAKGADDGEHYERIAANGARVSFGQTVNTAVTSGHRYGASIWMRATGKGTAPVTGSVTLWMLGGERESIAQTFNLGTAWTLVAASMVPKNGGHTSLRAEVYLDPTTGSRQLAMDGAWLGEGSGRRTYTARLTPEMQKQADRAAAFWKMPTTDLARAGVNALAYLAGVSGGDRRPVVPPPPNNGPITMATTYDANADVPVRQVAWYYAVTNDQAQYVGVGFMIYAAAVYGGL